MPGNRRHLEWFGPDLLRAPALSGIAPVAAVQIATALAQLRAPLRRDDSAIEEHADFIRRLAEVLFPDHASAFTLSVNPRLGRTIETHVLPPRGTTTLAHAWLADEDGAPPSSSTPDEIEFLEGHVVHSPSPGLFLMLAPESGLVRIRVRSTTSATWRWAVSAGGRAYYSQQLVFP